MDLVQTLILVGIKTTLVRDWLLRCTYSWTCTPSSWGRYNFTEFHYGPQVALDNVGNLAAPPASKDAESLSMLFKS